MDTERNQAVLNSIRSRLPSRLSGIDSECSLEGSKEGPAEMTKEFRRDDDDLFARLSWIIQLPGDEGQCKRFALTIEVMPREMDISDQLAHLGGESAGKALSDMIAEEVGNNPKDASKANFMDMFGLYNLGCFRRRARKTCDNIIDARLVNTWNLIWGQRRHNR